MPVKLIHEAADGADDFDLLTQTGELTLEAETVSDFLTHADFSAVFDHPAVKECISTIAGGKIAVGANADHAMHREVLSDLAEGDDDAVIQVISFEDALEVIDENDLEQMFLHYVESLPENTLEDRARRAAIANYYGLDEYAKGSFKKIRRKPGGPALVNRMLGAMMQKGLIKRAGKGQGYQGGDYTKTGQYATGPKKAATAKVAKFKKANVAKLKKQAMKAKRAKKNKLAASMGMESLGMYEAKKPKLTLGRSPYDGYDSDYGSELAMKGQATHVVVFPMMKDGTRYDPLFIKASDMGDAKAQAKALGVKYNNVIKLKPFGGVNPFESLDEGFEVADLPVFGFGLPVDGASFEVGTVGNVSVGESTEGSSPARASVLSEGARLVAGMNRVSQRING